MIMEEMIQEPGWTHEGTFYGVPILMDENSGAVMGKNLAFDYLLLFATWFHNFFIERFSQMFAAISGRDYEPGFPMYVKEIEK